jgi:hypothetical protein
MRSSSVGAASGQWARCGQQHRQRGLRRAARRVGWGVPMPRFVMHMQREAADARLLPLRPGHQPGQQQRGAGQHLLAGVGAGEELDAAVEAVGHGQPAARVGPAAEGAVDLVEQTGAETPRQPVARQAAQVPERVQPHALQRFEVLAAGVEQRQRRAAKQRLQGGQPGGVRAVGRVVAPARQQRRAERGRRAGDLHAVAERQEGRLQPLQQRGPAAEQAQAGLHFHQHRCHARHGAVERDRRREGQRRMHHRLQRGGVAGGVGLGQQHVGAQRQRGGALQPGPDAQSQRSGIRRDDVVIGHQRHRPRAVPGRQHGAESLQRQCGQVDGKPQHGRRVGRRRSRITGPHRRAPARRLRRPRPPATPVPRGAARAAAPGPTAPAARPAAAVAAAAGRGA